MANRAFVEARACVEPSRGAAWVEIGGVLAMFDGPASPCTQTFGLGLFSVPDDQQFLTLEKFFHERGAAVDHETSPLADASMVAALSARGYRPIEYSNVMFRPTALPYEGSRTEVETQLVGPADGARWARTAAEGWSSEGAPLAGFVEGIGAAQAASSGFHAFVATCGGCDIAAGGLFLHEQTAVLAGASTIPTARRRGAQQALLAARLRHAVAAGCDLSMMVASPGSGLQRNAERHGFRVAYTRIKWRLPRP